MSVSLDDDRRALAAAHVGLARHIARRAARRWPPLAEEFRSAALLGLCQAAAAFDPGRGVRFTTFAGRRIGGAIADERRAWYGHEGLKPRPAQVALGGRELRYEDPLAGDDPVGWELEYHDALAGLAAWLASPGQVAAFRSMYGRADCLDCVGAGRALGISGTRASSYRGAAVALLRAHFGPVGAGADLAGGGNSS